MFTASFYRALLCLIANFSVISSGMGLAFPSIASTQLLTELTSEQVSWIASVTAIACPIGGLISGLFCEKLGRKGTLIFIDILAIISWLLIGFSGAFLFVQLLIARVLIGFNIGMTTTPAVMYTSEVCHPDLRGRLTMLSSPFFTATGMVTIYFFGAVIASDFRIVSFYACGVSMATLLFCFLIPESPTHLVNRNKISDAKKSLGKIFNVSPSSPQIIDEVTKLQSNQLSTSKWQLSEFKQPQLYKPFLMMLAFFTIQQFSGIFTIFIFASQFSIEAGVSIDPFLSAVIIGVIRMVTTFIFAFISDKSGRRPLAIISSAGMCVAMTGLVMCGIFNETVRNSVIFWLPTALIYFFIFTGTFGILSLPFAMLGEVYPQKSRGLAAGLTISYAYTMSFVNVKTFAMVFDFFGSTIMFGFYAVMAIVGLLFSACWLVETKGKSLLEIEEHFKGKAKEVEDF